MKALAKLLAWVVGLIALLYIALVLVLTQIIKPDTYKQWVSKAAYKYAGRKVTIHGDLKLSFFPWIGVKVSGVTISNPKMFHGSPQQNYFAKIGEADIKIDLLALFVGKVEPKKIYLQNSTINLITTITGKHNWQLNQNNKSVPTNQNTDTSKKKDPETFKLDQLPSINIANANFNWIDQQKQQTFALSHVNLDTSSYQPNNPFNVKLSFKLLSTKPETELTAQTEATVLFNLEQQSIHLSNFRLALKLARYQQQIHQPINLLYQGDTLLNLSKSFISLQDFKLRFGDMLTRGSFEMKNFTSDPTFKGDIDIPEFNLHKLINSLGISYNPQNNEALQNVGLEAKIVSNKNVTKVENLQINLDQSRLNGSLTINASKLPKYVFNINLNQINLDNYLPNPSNKPNQNTDAGNNDSVKSIRTHKSQAVLPINALRELTWQGKMSIGSLTIHELRLSNLSLATQSLSEKINIEPIQAMLGDGSINAKLMIDLSNASPILVLNANAESIEAGSLLRAMTHKDLLTGTLNFNTKLQTEGNTKSAWRSNLNGTGKINLREGVIKGMDFASSVIKGLTILKRGPQRVQQDEEDQTRFTSFDASYVIQNGIVSNNDLQIKSNILNITGRGNINLINQTLNYRLNAKYLPQANLVIPLAVTGAIEKPTIRPDLAELGGEVIKSTIKKEIQKGVKDLFK